MQPHIISHVPTPREYLADSPEDVWAALVRCSQVLSWQPCDHCGELLGEGRTYHAYDDGMVVHSECDRRSDDPHYARSVTYERWLRGRKA